MRHTIEISEDLVDVSGDIATLKHTIKRNERYLVYLEEAKEVLELEWDSLPGGDDY